MAYQIILPESHTNLPEGQDPVVWNHKLCKKMNDREVAAPKPALQKSPPGRHLSTS